jgi:flagellar biosynthetic protein FlhB
MAESDESGERSEEATDTRREEFRKRGEVAQSRELASALFFVLSAGFLLFAGSYFLEHAHRLILSYTHLIGHRELGFSEKLALASVYFGKEFIYLVGPFVVLSLFIGLGSSLLQTGFLYVENAFELNWERINPVKGFQRIFSLRALVEGLKALLKWVILLSISYLLLRGEIHSFLRSLDWDHVVSGADFFFQRWQLEKRMMMTKQELKEEMKNREVDPLIKSRLRRMQREVAQKRMMNEVPKADVIITNPTHIAVALRYAPDMPAPKLIAKGADKVAEKIKEIAKAHNIPIIENKPLARVIFKTMKLDQFIPRELYVAVAEVLSYVYRLKKKRSFS